MCGEGHVWVTSLEQQLLRFRGPCHADSGCLLQQVDLVQLLPAFGRRLYPMDVQQCCRAAAGANSTSCLLVVTMHSGGVGAVVVLRVCVDANSQHAGVSVVSFVEGDKLLQQPNMVAVQQ